MNRFPLAEPHGPADDPAAVARATESAAEQYRLLQAIELLEKAGFVEEVVDGAPTGRWRLPS